MIRPIPLTHSSFVSRDITSLAGSERAQAKRHPEPLFDCGHHSSSLSFLEQREGQTADSEYLVRPECGIDFARPVIDVNYIVQASDFSVPESLAERGESALERVRPPRRKLTG